MTRTDEALRLLDERDAYMRTLGGCSDGGCIIVKPIGMHTNGGCKCSLDGFKTQRVMYMDNKTLDALRALLTQERDAWLPIATIPTSGQFIVYLSEPMQGSCVHSMNRHPNVSIVGGVFAFDAPKPTHWQPLPAPPRHDGKEKADG